MRKNISEWCNIAVFKPRNYFHLFIHLGSIVDYTWIFNFNLVQGKCISTMFPSCPNVLKMFEMCLIMLIQDIKCDSSNVYCVYLQLLSPIFRAKHVSKSRQSSAVALQWGFQNHFPHSVTHWLINFEHWMAFRNFENSLKSFFTRCYGTWCTNDHELGNNECWYPMVKCSKLHIAISR